MNSGEDDRSPVSKAVGISSQITTIGMMMIIPAIGGYFLDQWLGTFVLMTVLGLFLGVASSVIQLSRLIQYLNAESYQSVGEKTGEFESDESQPREIDADSKT